MCKLQSEKKTELSTSCHFYWCDINFLETCANFWVLSISTMIIDGAEIHCNYQSKKKIELSMSCQFYWCDIYFFTDVCKLPSVVNFDCDLSLIIDPAEVHYNFIVKKNWFVKILVCYEHFFFGFFDVITMKKVSNS